MFDSPILDVAIALVFVFFLMSILVSGIVEIIASFFEFRGKDLRWALDEVFNDPGNKNWTELMYEHPLIDGLKKTDDHLPSRISPDLFAKALVDVMIYEGREVKYIYDPNGLTQITESYPFDKFLIELMTQEENAADEKKLAASRVQDMAQNLRADNVQEYTQLRKELLEDARALIDSPATYTLELDKTKIEINNSFGTFYNFRAGVGTLKTSDVKTLLNNFIYKSKDYDELKNHLEAWYKEYMGQASEWYKNKIRYWLFGAGLLSAIILNVDSIKMASELYVNQDLRDMVVAQAVITAQKDYATAVEDIRNPKPAATQPAPPDTGKKEGETGQAGTQAASDETEPTTGDTETEPTTGDTETEPVTGDTETEPVTGDTEREPQPGASDAEPGEASDPAPAVPAQPAVSTPGVQQVSYEDSLKKQWNGIINTYKSLDALNLPIGWNNSPDTLVNECATGFWGRIQSSMENVKADIRYTMQGNLLLILLGWFFTGIAVTLGAPFWFELMKRLVSMRTSKENTKAT